MNIVGMSWFGRKIGKEESRPERILGGEATETAGRDGEARKGFEI